MHTTIMTATNTMLDLISSDPNAKFWEQLREEAAGVFQTVDDWTNAASVPKLQLADSTIRESLRENSMLTRVMLREVVAKDGVVLPSGHHVPRGAWMGVGTSDLHHDDRFYPRAQEYDPFRFAKKQEDVPTDQEALIEKAPMTRKHQSLSTASDVFLAFGYGKHAWYVSVVENSSSSVSDGLLMVDSPGRWLVSHQLKLMLAYVTLNYDIQHIGQRPVNQVFGDSVIPSRTATMMVRRRKQT